jgi:hypothetical protein
MTSGRPFIQPQLVTDSSDDNNDDDDFQPSERPKRRNLKPTDVKNGGRTSNRSNGDSVAAPQLAKNPLADSDSDLEEILPEPKKKQEDGSSPEEEPKKNLRSNKRPPPPQKKSSKKGGGKKPAKRPRRAKKGGDSNSDDEDFDPGSDDEEEDGSDDADEASVHSEDLSPEENISDSDFVPSDEAEEGKRGSDEDADETIHLSSDGESPAPKKAGTATAAGGRNNENIQTFDPNSAVREK